jgi:hypothetical protein
MIMKRFDNLILRPFIIYHYDAMMIKKKAEFLEMFMKEGEVWENYYMEDHKEEEL